MPSDFKPMTTVGAGVFEIWVRSGNQYRVIYAAKFSVAVYVLHAFVKKTQKTAAPDLDDNVFHDLGFAEPEAQNLLLRADLVSHIRKVILKLDITQAEAAQRAGISQPRMNDLVKGRTHKFTLDALVNVAAKLGYTVKLSLKRVA
eukprot:gene22361-28482_t